MLVASDAIVASVALASAVLTPASWDDGWVVASVRGFADTGRFSVYYEKFAATVLQGGWWDALLYPIMSATDNVVVFRLPFVLLTATTWWVVRRWVIDVVSDGPARRAARFAGAATAVLVIPAWMTTLRWEPLIAFLAAVAMAATIRFCQRPSFGPLLTGLFAGAVAMTVHQTGWVVVATIAPALLFFPQWLQQQRSARVLAVAGAVLVATSVGLVLAAFDTDLSLLRRAASEWTSAAPGSPVHTYGPFDDWRRPYDTIVFHSAVRLAAMLLPLFGLIAALMARQQTREPDARRIALWCSVAGYLGLSLTSSKLSWHYAAVMPFSIVLVAIGFQRLLADESNWPRLKRILAAGSLGLLGAFAFSRTRAEPQWMLKWNEFDLSKATWSELQEIDLLGGLDVSRPVVWLIGLAVVAGALMGLRSWQHRPIDVTRGLLTVALGAVCVMPVALTGSLLVRDARSSDGWSFTGQLLSSAAGRANCGLPEDLPVVTSGAPLTETTGSDDIAPASEDAYLHASTNSALPIAGISTWGTRAASAATANPDEVTGRYSTPWYTSDGTADIAFWTAGRIDGLNRISIDARLADGEVISVPVARSTNALYWSIHRVRNLPRDAVALRLVLQDSDSGGWLAATAPATVTYKPLSEFLSAKDRVWVEQQYYLYAPCLDLPSIRDGYLHPFAVSLVTPPVWGTASPVMSEGALVEIGCIATGPCAYRVEMRDAATLLTT